MKLTEKQETNKTALAQLKNKDRADRPLDVLKRDFKKTAEQWENLSREMGTIEGLLQADTENRERLRKEEKELRALEKDGLLWATMNDLIGDAKGNKFSNFVQDLTLEQLIGYANKRLAEFTDRYTLDIPTAKEAEKSDTLKILDAYMGNARRSVRTLSGGETFLVSLAMAFALSDIAARNVKIASLFIDEALAP